jgi:hypothetical protein
MSGLDARDEWTTLLPGFLVAGTGIGLLNPVIADVAVSVVPKEQSGMASGVNDTFRQLGIAVGIAAWGAIFLGRGAGEVQELASATPAASGDRSRELVEAVSSGTLDQLLVAVPAGARDTVAWAGREGFLAGINETLVLAGLLALVWSLLTLLLVREHEIERRQRLDADLAPEAARA